MSTTTANIGTCDRCGLELHGSFIGVDGYYFHSWCAPSAQPPDLKGPHWSKDEVLELRAEIARLTPMAMEAEALREKLRDLRRQLDETHAERDVTQHLLTDLWKLYSGEGKPSHDESTMRSKCDACRFQADVEKRIAMFLDPGYRP